MNDRALLRDLDAEIPILEEKLRAMKVTRKRLKAAEQMRAKRKDKAFKAATIAAVRAQRRTPEGRAQWAAVRKIAGERLPWPRGTPEYKRYDRLRHSGYTREGAIEKIGLETRFKLAMAEEQAQHRIDRTFAEAEGFQRGVRYADEHPKP